MQEPPQSREPPISMADRVRGYTGLGMRRQYTPRPPTEKNSVGRVGGSKAAKILRRQR